jgi:capsular exopolysaccharide synthesis family protein
VGGAPQQDLTLRDYLAPILARRWLVLGCVILLTGAVFAWYSTRPKVYEAATKLFVAQEANTLLGSGAGFSDNRTVENQATLLTSLDVASEVAKRIDYPGSAASLASRVTATPTEGADFIEIHARGDSGKQAADIANGFADAFIKVRSDDRRNQALKALEELRRQLRELPRRQENVAARAEIATQIRQLEVLVSTGTGAARQVDPALPPASASSPRPVRSTLLAFPLALLGSILLAYMLHRLDPRLRNIEEAAAIYDRPVIGTIHHDDDIDGRQEGLPALSAGSKEAFRALRVSIELAALERPLRTILVTSAGEGEGKSTVTRNLALALEEAGRSVLVVDGDLRKASISAMFGEDSSVGFADAVADQRGLQTVVKTVEVAQPTRRRGVPETNGTTPDHVSLIPAGAEPANPSVVLASKPALALLSEASERFDITLIDTPPLLPVSDTIPLLSQVDGIVMVARSGVTDRRIARRAAEIISRVPETNVLGVVLNDLEAGPGSGYGGYYGTYGSRSRPPVGTSS